MRVRGIISALNKKAVTNILCTYHHGREVPGIETIRTWPIPGYTKQEAGPSPFKYLADILLIFKVCGVMQRRRPDIIHGHLHEGALIGWVARTIFFWRRIPLVFDVQGSLISELDAHGYFKNSKLLRRIFWTIEFFVTRLPQHFICSSERSVAILQNEFGVERGKIQLVNDGVDIDWAGRNVSDTMAANLTVPRDRPIVIYTGGLLPAKGLHNLFNIIRESRQSNINCHFLIVGYPARTAREFVKSERLQEYCTIVGRVPFEELSIYLSTAAVAVEPKGMDAGEASGKLLNYMGAGLPVVCFDTVTNRQILADTGYYVPPGSIEKFVQMIQAIVESPDLGKQRGALGHLRARKLFSWDAGADCIRAIYDRVGS